MSVDFWMQQQRKKKGPRLLRIGPKITDYGKENKFFLREQSLHVFVI